MTNRVTMKPVSRQKCKPNLLMPLDWDYSVAVFVKYKSQYIEHRHNLMYLHIQTLCISL